MSGLASDFFMVFQQDILDLNNLFNLLNLSTFIHNIPVEWVEFTFRLSSSATIRKRRLPADQVFWLVLGMAIFRAVLIHEAARRLNICDQWLASYDLLTRIGLTEARKHLGADPVEWLFHQTDQHWGHEHYPADHGKLLSELKSGIGSLFLEKRSKPTRPRTVKMSKTPYPLDHHAAPVKRTALPSSRSFCRWTIQPYQ